MSEAGVRARLEESRHQSKELEFELARIRGSRGICSRCEGEGVYSDRVNRICTKCWREAKIAAAREKYVHLIGLKVEDVVIEADYYPLIGIKLEGGYLIEVGSDRDGGSYFEISRKPGGHHDSL